MFTKYSKRLVTLTLTLALFLPILVFTPYTVKANGPTPPASGLNTLTDQNVNAGKLEPLYYEVTQIIEVKDDDGDANTADVTITSIELDNLGDAPATDIARVDILNGADQLKGTLEVTSGSFPLTVETPDFTVADETSATIKVRFKIATTTTGGTLKPQTTIVHDEGTSTGIRKAVDDGTAETISSGQHPLSFKVTKEGNVHANKSYHGEDFVSGDADLAEKVKVTDKVEPGDVLSLNTDNPNQYHKSQKPYSSLAAGVVSTEPGVTLGTNHQKPKTTIALMGTVPVKATTQNGPIHPGDLLTTSSKPGYAMVCKDKAKCSGAIIGKALGLLEEGEGKVSMLVVG